jgi:hypothetical protein
VQTDLHGQSEMGWTPLSSKEWALRCLEGTVRSYVWVIGKKTIAAVVSAERVARELGASKEEVQAAIQSGLDRTTNSGPDRVSKIRLSFLT